MQRRFWLTGLQPSRPRCNSNQIVTFEADGKPQVAMKRIVE